MYDTISAKTNRYKPNKMWAALNGYHNQKNIEMSIGTFVVLIVSDFVIHIHITCNVRHICVEHRNSSIMPFYHIRYSQFDIKQICDFESPYCRLKISDIQKHVCKIMKVLGYKIMNTIRKIDANLSELQICDLIKKKLK